MFKEITFYVLQPDSNSSCFNYLDWGSVSLASTITGQNKVTDKYPEF
jgi:hypothetical protein